MMQTTGLNRDTTDKFYTKSTVAINCCQLVEQFLDINKDIDIIIEPSAGNGSFIEPITNITTNTLFYDILPEHSKIVRQDFLKLNLSSIQIPDVHTRIHIIGNPPFGRQSSLAIKFIKYATSFCDTISFILPKSFKKDSMQKHLPPNFHLIYQEDLDDNSFVINSNTTSQQEKDVPCVFQIWDKKNYNRNTIIKQNPNNFCFVKREEEPDISFRRVGVNAGTIDIENLHEKSIQSHYFIKFDETIDKKSIITLLKNIVYENNNTVGPKSISKQEIIKEFNKIIA